MHPNYQHARYITHLCKEASYRRWPMTQRRNNFWKLMNGREEISISDTFSFWKENYSFIPTLLSSSGQQPYERRFYKHRQFWPIYTALDLDLKHSREKEQWCCLTTGMRLWEQQPCDKKHHGKMTINIQDMDFKEIRGERNTDVCHPALGHCLVWCPTKPHITQKCCCHYRVVICLDVGM
jgi:hypothetical protein